MKLEDKDKVLLGAATIIAAAIYFAPTPAKQPRYAMISGGQNLAAYRLDLQTGAIIVCYADECGPVKYDRNAFSN